MNTNTYVGTDLCGCCDTGWSSDQHAGWMSQLLRSSDLRKPAQSTVENHMAMHNQILIWTKQGLVRKEDAGIAQL